MKRKGRKKFHPDEMDAIITKVEENNRFDRKKGYVTVPMGSKYVIGWYTCMESAKEALFKEAYAYFSLGLSKDRALEEAKMAKKEGYFSTRRPWEQGPRLTFTACFLRGKRKDGKDWI